jgi:hypothetical protein
MVAVFGEIDGDTGGIVGASILDAGNAGFSPETAYLTGFVDSVDYLNGIAMVSGMAVDYTALLSDGAAPGVGDMVSIAGRDYGDRGLLVADPQLRLEIR